MPRVSTYRMAGHLLSAFVIFSTLVWTTLSVAVRGGVNAGSAAFPMARHVATAVLCRSPESLACSHLPCALPCVLFL